MPTISPIRFVFRFAGLFFLVVSWLIAVQTARSEETTAGAAANGLPVRTYFFFPYQACVVCTIKEATTERSPTKWNKGWVKLTVNIENVLRGSFAEGKTIVLTFDEPVSKIKPVKSVEELKGLRCVLAFHPYSQSGESQAICHIYSPFTGQAFSEEDIKNLKRQLQMVSFPNRQCVMATIEEVRPADSTGDILVSANIDELLLVDKEDALSKFLANDADKKSILKLRLMAGSNEEREQLKQLKTGMKSILGFDWSWFEPHDALFWKWQECRLVNVTTPFPGQIFSAGDLERLRTRLTWARENNEKLKNALQEYLEDRWTVDRIQKYCKPERRVAQPLSDLLRINHSMFLDGQLYPSLEKEIGKVSWYCGVDSGIPDQYEVNVSRPTNVPGLKRPDYWILESTFPNISKLSDDEFVINLIRDTLFNNGFNYDRTHRDSTKTDLLKGIYQVTDKRLIRAKDGNITAFTCLLSDGKRLEAELDHALTIKSIQIDGKQDKYWTEAVLNAAKNIDTLNRIDESYQNSAMQKGGRKP
jgi:hypothetical protein